MLLQNEKHKPKNGAKNILKTIENKNKQTKKSTMNEKTRIVKNNKTKSKKTNSQKKARTTKTK